MKDRESRMLHVPPGWAGQTLSAVLRRWRAGETWSRIRRLVQTRRVMVSGNVCVDPNRRVNSTDVIKLLEQSAPPPVREADVRIRYIDDALIVVEKPSGITSMRHPEEASWPVRRRQLQPTLDELLPGIVARRERGHGRLKTRPIKAVHRLDRETSGLMVFARTAAASHDLSEQFRRHTIERVYWAIASGSVESQTIESRLVEDRGDGRRGSTDQQNAGRRAVTHVHALESLAGYTVIECRLETGRTHQIRIHLAEIGHPICGEKVYNRNRHVVQSPDRSKASRLALHAARLGFRHPTTDEQLHFEMPLPADLRELLIRLRNTQSNGNPASA